MFDSLVSTLNLRLKHSSSGRENCYSVSGTAAKIRNTDKMHVTETFRKLDKMRHWIGKKWIHHFVGIKWKEVELTRAWNVYKCGMATGEDFRVTYTSTTLSFQLILFPLSCSYHYWKTRFIKCHGFKKQYDSIHSVLRVNHFSHYCQIGCLRKKVDKLPHVRKKGKKGKRSKTLCIALALLLHGLRVKSL